MTSSGPTIDELQQRIKELTAQLEEKDQASKPEESTGSATVTSVSASYSARSQISIMISLQVSSMHKSALYLKSELEKQGYTVWICTEMVGGVDFREQIVAAVNACTVFLPLINTAWGDSGECRDEFSLAKRLHLTSHESGRTTRDKPRLPIFMPIAFSDLDWGGHPHIQLLAASTNFIVHRAPTLESGDCESTMESVLIAMHNFGMDVDLPARAKQTVELNNKKFGAKQRSTRGPREQLLAITDSLQAFATSIQAMAMLEKGDQSHGNRTDEDSEVKEELCREYLGVTSGSNKSNHQKSYGYVLRYWSSVRLEIDGIDAGKGEKEDESQVSATITMTNLRKEVTTPEGKLLTAAEVPTDDPMYAWVTSLCCRTSKFKGVFRAGDLMLIGECNRVQELVNGVENHEVAPYKFTYHLALHRGELVGATLGRSSVSRTILKPIV